MMMKAVREVMQESILTINPDDTIVRAAQMMAENDAGSLVVTNPDNKPTGIITERDIVQKVVAREKPGSAHVSEVMSNKIVSIKPDDTIDQASKLMKENNVKELLVIEYDRLLGMITSADIAKLEPEMLDEYRKMLSVSE